MSGGGNGIQRTLYRGLLLAAIVSSVSIDAKGSGSVPVVFGLRDSNITLHEPVYVEFSVRNELPETISFDLGFDRKQGFRFSVGQPDGSSVDLPRYERGGLGVGGAISLGAGDSYKQSILFDELFQATKPGSYRITVSLAAPITTRSGRRIAPPAPEKLQLLVGERDAKRLAGLCERLASAAVGPEYEAAREAAFALRYVQDPAAIPYLDRVITKAGRLKGLAVTGLARIGTPEAVDVLKSHLNTSDQTLRSEIEVALWEIKTGLKVQVLD